MPQNESFDSGCVERLACYMFGGFLVSVLSFVLNNDATVLRMVAFVAVGDFITSLSFYCVSDEDIIIYFVNTVIDYKCLYVYREHSDRLYTSESFNVCICVLAILNNLSSFLFIYLFLFILFLMLLYFYIYIYYYFLAFGGGVAAEVVLTIIIVAETLTVLCFLVAYFMG